MDVIIDTIVKISIHALHEESDSSASPHLGHVRISIHALHEESDCNHCGPASWPSYFNPRSP